MENQDENTTLSNSMLLPIGQESCINVERITPIGGQSSEGKTNIPVVEISDKMADGSLMQDTVKNSIDNEFVVSSGELVSGTITEENAKSSVSTECIQESILSEKYTAWTSEESVSLEILDKTASEQQMDEPEKVDSVSRPPELEVTESTNRAPGHDSVQHYSEKDSQNEEVLGQEVADNDSVQATQGTDMKDAQSAKEQEGK